MHADSIASCTHKNILLVSVYLSFPVFVSQFLSLTHISCVQAGYIFSFFIHLRFLESLLRQASNALILHCPTMHCFVNQATENDPNFRAEEFSDVSGWPQSLIWAILPAAWVNMSIRTSRSISHNKVRGVAFCTFHLKKGRKTAKLISNFWERFTSYLYKFWH